jgi:hypothetical protein
MTDLVTTDSVRAALGVSAQELPDAVLTNSIYSTRLREDLRDLNTQIISDFAMISALTVRTADQDRFLDLMQAYAAYNVAQQCLGALPMFAPLTIKDEKAELTRNVNPYEQLGRDIGAVLSAMRSRLQKAYALINTAAQPPAAIVEVFGVAVGLSTDPVTGA